MVFVRVCWQSSFFETYLKVANFISVLLGSWILASSRDFWMMMVKDDFCQCVCWQSSFFETYLKVVNLISMLLGSWILASSRDFLMVMVKDDFCPCVCWQSSFFETYLKVVNSKFNNQDENFVVFYMLQWWHYKCNVNVLSINITT